VNEKSEALIAKPFDTIRMISALGHRHMSNQETAKDSG
jgi:hypothetical protein